jgi:Ribonuclease G/E
LVRGIDALVASTPDGSPEHELARTTEMLGTDVPDDWGVRWEYTAEDADMSVLDAALAKAVERVEAIETGLASGADQDGLVARPAETVWVWFGRDSRFELDEYRDAVTPTMTGHHRIKAGSDAASAAVDFVEHLDRVGGEFPFEAVTDVFGPTEGSTVTIAHGKPGGHCFTLGQGTVTDRSIPKERITVHREMTTGGTYDAIGSAREPGDLAITRFAEGRWWYPTLYRGEDGQSKGTYVNIATPIEIFPDTVRYMDLYIDVVKRPDGTVEIVDEAELDDAVDAGRLSEDIAERAKDVAQRVAAAFEPE